MKFEEFKYERPDIKLAQKKMKELTDIIGSDCDVKTELKAIKDLFKLMDELDTLENIASIRNAVDTTDEFYEKEQEFFDFYQELPFRLQFPGEK